MKLHLMKLSIALMIFGTMFQANTSAVDVSVQSVSFRPNVGSFDISVLLNNNTPNILNVATFSIQLAITPTGPRRVEFSTPQPDTLTNPNYIFFGNSASVTDFTTPWRVSSSSGGTNDEFTFVDSTNDTTPYVSLNVGDSKLLSLVRMTPGAGSLIPLEGEQFTISVVADGTSFYDDNVEHPPISYTSTPGILTTLPEPSTYAMVVIGTGVLIACRRSRKTVKNRLC